VTEGTEKNSHGGTGEAGSQHMPHPGTTFILLLLVSDRISDASRGVRKQ
jgi:hypothetical protein